MDEELNVTRTDAVYMAHSYLTKVPVAAIEPFIKKYTKPGDIVLDPFAGSGMTGIAAIMHGRTAWLSDISVLGKHIGSNYSRLVDPERLNAASRQVVAAVVATIGDVYAVEAPDAQGQSLPAKIVKTVWSCVYQCNSCKGEVIYYDAFKSAHWKKKSIRCPHCSEPLGTRAKRIGEIEVADFLESSAWKTQKEFPPLPKAKVPSPPELDLWEPQFEIPQDREMAKSSALSTNGRLAIKSFYSPRNWLTLCALFEKIHEIEDKTIQDKLLFAFTAILTRASKRYQWSPTRPLNAANQNYYVAPVFYEWNVLDLFERKVRAIQRSDEWILNENLFSDSCAPIGEAKYRTMSATCLDIPNSTVDYVFTDPPFGSNLFYSDMALFQEVWLSDFTDETLEAVVDRSANGKRDSERYEMLLTQSLKECRRVLKPGGKVSFVFGNSSGKMWALVQRAIQNSGFKIEPTEIVILNKGQRSVKGLASGFEHVATLDLILTLSENDQSAGLLKRPSKEDLSSALAEIVVGFNQKTVSHAYLELLRFGIRSEWDLSRIHLRDLSNHLIRTGWTIDPVSGLLNRQ